MGEITLITNIHSFQLLPVSNFPTEFYFSPPEFYFFFNFRFSFNFLLCKFFNEINKSSRPDRRKNGVAVCVCVPIGERRWWRRRKWDAVGGGEKQERKEKKGRVETPTDATARRTWESSHGPKSRSSAAAARLVLRPSNKTVKTKQKNVSSTHRWTVYMYTITDASLEFRSPPEGNVSSYTSIRRRNVQSKFNPIQISRPITPHRFKWNLTKNLSKQQPNWKYKNNTNA